MSVLLGCGIGVPTALEVLASNPDDPALGGALEQLASKISQGHSLSAAMRDFPGIFSDLHLGLVVAGEHSGLLAESFQQVAAWTDLDLQTRHRLRAVLTYPAIVVAVTLALTFLLFRVFIPQILGALPPGLDPPALTRLLMLMTNMTRNPGVWIVALGASGLVYSILQELRQTPHGARGLARLGRRMPVVGRLMIALASTRYSQAMSTLLSQGLAVLTALRLAGRACGDALIAWDCERLIASLQEGETLAESMESQPEVYPPLLTSLVAVGEETGKMVALYQRASEIFSLESEHLLESLSAALEPVVMGFVALLVGFVVLAVFSSVYAQLNSLG
ncbi:MAG: type II secretion system F family protein [Vulcanimicrobiota bacterium]